MRNCRVDHQGRDGCCGRESESYLGEVQKGLRCKSTEHRQHPSSSTITQRKSYYGRRAICIPVGSCSSSRGSTSRIYFPWDQHGIDALADALAGLEARLLCRLQALEDKLTALQREILETCTALPPPAPLPSLPPAMSMFQELQTNLPPPSPVAPLQSSPATAFQMLLHRDRPQRSSSRRQRLPPQ